MRYRNPHGLLYLMYVGMSREKYRLFGYTLLRGFLYQCSLAVLNQTSQ